MQLKLKKVGLLSTLFIYCASFLIQSNLVFFQTRAQERNVPRVNIVAILVDDKIYGGISEGLEWYASSYIQGKLADTKALVMPLDLDNIKAYDIYRMMENIYFDGLENVNSTLIGLIMFGDIPLPVVNQDGYIFPTVYPYVDFENQKYVRDEETQYFIPNGNKKGQAEVWHGLINYGSDIQSYLNFFGKIDSYISDPDEFIGDSMWYDDFIAQKEAFSDEDFQYYRNKIMFGEDVGYQRYSTLMKSLFGDESKDSSADIISELSENLGVDFMGMDGVEEALAQESNSTMHTTKLDQQEIETSYLADYNELFSKNISSTIRENIFAGGRWIKLYKSAEGKTSHVVDVDSSSSFIQLKDTMYLGNDDLQGMIENLNMLMEDMIDRKIADNRYDMDIVIPVSYKKTTGKRIKFKCNKFVSRFDNYYFGENARYIDEAKKLSIYRGNYRNLSDLEGVTVGDFPGSTHDLLEGNNPVKSEYDPVDVKLKSIGGAYGIFSSQTAGNRGYMMTAVDRDYQIYEEERVADEPEKYRDIFNKVVRLVWPKNCSMDDEDNICENLFDFAQRWWGGASPINLDEESIPTGKYRIKGYLATDARRSIFDMGGFQSLLSGDDEGMSGREWVSGDGVGPQWAATNFNSYIKYSSPTQREGWERNVGLQKDGWGLNPRSFSLGIGYVIYENHTPNVHMSFDDMDYWKLPSGIINGWDFSKESKSIFNVTSKGKLLSCPRFVERTLQEQYKYKVISSIVVHKSPTNDEINGIDIDKYGESGTLGQYYRDLRTSYQDVKDDTQEVLDGLLELSNDIEEVRKIIDGKVVDLKGKLIDYKTGSVELKKCENALSGHEAELVEVQEQLQGLLDGTSSNEGTSSDGKNNSSDIISDIKNKFDNFDALSETGKVDLVNEILKLPNVEYEGNDDIDFNEFDFDEFFKDYSIDWFSDYTESLTDDGNDDLIEGLNKKINELTGDISIDESCIKTEREALQPLKNDIELLIEQLSGYINEENLDLTDIYKLVMSLYVENIISVMEYINYMEWGNPEDFYSGLPNKAKVGFLPEWISDIQLLEKNIKEDGSKIISDYEKAYDMLEEQKKDWEKFADEFKEEVDEEMGDLIDKLTAMMNAMFKVSEDSTEDEVDDYDLESVEDEEDSPFEVELTRDSADDAINGEDGLIGRLDDEQGVSAMFSWLVEVDTLGPAIENAAKSDTEFKIYLIRNGTNFNDFSQADWINQYVAWTKGPGYDSEGAKKNHDLLIGVSEHMSGMNILTPDRPIDSPRFISMQSVAGNEMKFIYPDLFKVEVYKVIGTEGEYDVHELLTGSDIKSNLIKYLEGKVDEYNTILDKECGSALGMNIYYNRLRQLGYDTATPDTSVHNCGERFTYDEFVDAIGGKEMLDIIPDILYYQSLTNPVKLGHKMVKKDIEKTKKSFTINEKRRLTLLDYLTEGNEEIKSPLFVIPMYEIYGYEVAFINSNGRDYIFPEIGSDYDDITGGISFATTFKGTKARSTGISQPSPQVSEYNDECNIPSSGRLPIFKLSGTSVSSPWYEGFKCWLKKTLKEPVKIRLSFDGSLGEVVVSEGFGKFMESLGKAMFSETADAFTEYGDSMTKYRDAWDEIINPKDEHDADVEITKLQVEAEKHNQSVIGLDGGSDSLTSVSRNVKVSNSNDLLTDSNPSSVLGIESLVDLGNITVEFIGTGDGCISVGQEATLCRGSSFSKTFNPKTEPLNLVISSADHKAGKFALDLKIGAGGGYIEKIIKYTISPSFLDRAEIILDDNKTIAGMISPVTVIGYDKYDNPISWSTDKFDFTVSQGRFLKDGAYQDSFTTNDFRDLRFYYHAPLDAQDGSLAEIQISNVKNPGEYLATYNQMVVQAAPEIKLNGTVVLNSKDNLETDQSYNLKSDESIYDGTTLLVPKLQRIDVVMKDLKGDVVDVDSQIMVTSKNGLVTVGQVQTQEEGGEIFFETSLNVMSSGYATIYYYPTTVAGDDVINIDIPGLDTRKINLKINSAPTASIQVDINEGYVELNETTYFEIFTDDIWGNPVDETVYVTYDPGKVRFPNLIPVSHAGSLWTDMAIVKDGYLKTDIFGYGAGLTEVLVGSTSVRFKVDDNLFPEDKLNILYLNYFGNDRGNQWGYFSDNNKYIEKLMTNSNKIITTTTQLVSEDKIKKILWKIEPEFKIWNYDDFKTYMIMDGGNMNVFIGSITSMKDPIPSLTWMSTSNEEIENILGNKSSASKNYGFFVPSDEKYYVDRNGVLYDDGVRVGSILKGEINLLLTDESFEGGDNIWTVIDRGINYGEFILHYPKFVPSAGNFEIPDEGFVVNPTFYGGSTDSLSDVGIFDVTTDFELETSYKSIQNSDEIEERIGFLGDFKNVTLFAEGEFVGEATLKFGSEFVINLGDPLLSKKHLNEPVYGTSFDGGIGNEIFVDSENDIFGNYEIDFNNDGLMDLLVVYKDGSIKLAKNYGGTPDLKNMQDLMRVAISIEDVFVGDADGNGYDDIIVRAKNNQIRVYLNDKGIFDVDGSLACLNQNVFGGEISSTPSSLEGIFQLFVEDMDLDGVVDIVTYDDKGYIKVFYGGTTNGGPNYLSLEKYACDSGWYNRQAKNTTIAAAYGTQVTSDDIFDNSMLHWIGMIRPPIEITEDQLEHYGIYFDPNNLDSLISKRVIGTDGSIEGATLEIMDVDDPSIPRYKTDVSDMSQRYVDEGAKYVDITLYENELVGGGDGDNYIFAPSSYLDPDADIDGDDGSVWKNYTVKSGGAILQDGDIVTVRVTVKANDFKPFRGTFGDIIQGPRNLYYDEYEILKGIRFISNKRGAIVKKRDGNFSYIIDNITLGAGEKMIFEYDLEYHNMPLKKIDITYETYYSSDALPDIKVQSSDGCSKNFGVHINGGRSFGYIEVPLQDMINDEYLSEDDKSEDYTADILSVGSDVNQLPGIVGDSISRISLINSRAGAMTISNDEKGKKELKNEILKMMSEGVSFNGGGVDLDIDLNIFENQTDEIENVIDDITKGMCNGFSFGGANNCKGLPVPFNQAFLAPGKYHLFGCRDLPMGDLEKGIPIFFFPGTVYALAPIPIPRGQKLDGVDQFIWPGGGFYPSFIRIYAAPTLTAQLGIAVCLGPDAIWRNVPSPVSDIMGNCIVFAVKPQCKSDDSGNDGQDLDNPNEVYTEYIEDVRDSGYCQQSQKGFMVTLKGERSTPFNLYSYSSQVKQLGNRKDFSWADTRDTITWKNMDVNGGSNNGVEYNTSFMGIIELETSSYVGADPDFYDNTKNSIYIGDVDILGGNFNVNKIKGGLQQGIRKLLIDKWLDPQIRYILNQLTKMHINIKLPDLSNLLDNEVKTLENLNKNIGTIWDEGSSNNTGSNSNTGNKNSNLVSYWANINYETMNNFNKSISNPFESLANLMNESNIINISTETLTVKIPMVFKEDIDSYYLYLLQWLDENQKIVDDWEAMFDTFTTSCSKLPTVKEQNECRAKRDSDLSSFIEFKNVDWERMKNQIYANLVVLQKYREFPFEIYEWIHVIDRYMAEIASLINNTIGYLSYWTSVNSERFVGYVDAIVLIINIIKTYQLLIDFSIEWGQNCGNCARDTYDQYSCKLSFLCEMIQLPIFQIPNFKLPNITIDLTNIDLGLDIILPEFNFQPVRINLPQLPNLPEPPTISVNIKLFDLPNIPILPEPPELPELPSFIPEIELELPILPPAPEVPRLPNEIEALIRIAKLIGKIYCIVKGQFGLVGESSVKAKIEQLTQRTYDVDWIDTIMDFTNRSYGPVHNYGVDYEIDSYVDFQFNFTDFYDYLDILTKSINSLSTSTVNWTNSQLDNIVNDNAIINLRDEIDGASIGVDVTLIGDGGLISKSDLNTNVDGLLSDDIEYVDYESGKSRLSDVLAYFKEEVINTSLEDNVISSINKIENQINRKNSIVPNEKGIEKVKSDVMEYLDAQKVNYDDLAEIINSDYDSFLAMVDSNSINSSIEGNDDNKFLTFGTQLFNLDSSAKDSINNIVKTNPYKTLLDNKKTIINGYLNAVDTNSAADLGMSNVQYLVLRNKISSMNKGVNALYTLTKPVSSTSLIAKDSGKISNKSLLTLASSESPSTELGARIGSQMDAASVVDPSLLSKGIYEITDDGKQTKVIYSDSFAEAKMNTYYYTKNHDIVLWDENSIYKKCVGQSCINYGGGDGKYYHSKTIKEIPYEETWVEFDSSTKLKIADDHLEVKNRKVASQNYDVLSFTWNTDDVDGYLIKLVERIDYSYEKSDHNPKAKSEIPHYVLALPETVDIDGILNDGIKLELLNKKIKEINALSGNELLQIVYYNPMKENVYVGVSNVERKWYYSRIATLDLIGDTYNITSPWSNQLAAGRQIVGDDQAPDGDALLIRKATQEIASEGDDLEGYVGTRYKLKIDWKDNVALSYINLAKDGEILTEKYTSEVSDSVSIDIDLHTKTEKETYITKGIDQFGNETEKNVTVSFLIPEITISDVSKNSDGQSVAITAELSQDIDQGNVSFQRRRGTLRKSMSRNGADADIPIGVGDRIVVGSPYSAGNSIATYDKNGNVMALIDPNSAEIKVQSGYTDSFDIRVKVEDEAVLQIYDKENQKPLFSIVIPATECVKFEAESYNIISLPKDGKMGKFNGGTAIAKDGTNILFASPTCDLYSEFGLEGTYDYDRELEAVKLTLFQKSDLKKKFPIKVWLKAQPFMNS